MSCYFDDKNRYVRRDRVRHASESWCVSLESLHDVADLVRHDVRPNGDFSDDECSAWEILKRCADDARDAKLSEDNAEYNALLSDLHDAIDENDRLRGRLLEVRGDRNDAIRERDELRDELNGLYEQIDEQRRIIEMVRNAARIADRRYERYGESYDALARLLNDLDVTIGL